MSREKPEKNVKNEDSKSESEAHDTAPADAAPAKEVGGRGGLDPTRYGDWEKSGRCIDF